MTKPHPLPRGWRIGNRTDPLPGDDAPPSATSIHITDCGDPKCHCAHIMLYDGINRIGLAQATVNLEMVKSMAQIIASKVFP